MIGKQIAIITMTMEAKPRRIKKNKQRIGIHNTIKIQNK